jgi:hypothetical protein
MRAPLPGLFSLPWVWVHSEGLGSAWPLRTHHLLFPLETQTHQPSLHGCYLSVKEAEFQAGEMLCFVGACLCLECPSLVKTYSLLSSQDKLAPPRN